MKEESHLTHNILVKKHLINLSQLLFTWEMLCTTVAIYICGFDTAQT